MYSGDTVIICEPSGDFQKVFDVYYEYCTAWKLTVNTAKTEVLVFSYKKEQQLHSSYNSSDFRNC